MKWKVGERGQSSSSSSLPRFASPSPLLTLALAVITSLTPPTSLTSLPLHPLVLLFLSLRLRLSSSSSCLSAFASRPPHTLSSPPRPLHPTRLSSRHPPLLLECLALHSPSRSPPLLTHGSYSSRSTTSSRPETNGPVPEITISGDFNQALGCDPLLLTPPPPSSTTTTISHHHHHLSPPPAYPPPLPSPPAPSAVTASTIASVGAPSTLRWPPPPSTCHLHLHRHHPPSLTARRFRYRHTPPLGRRRRHSPPSPPTPTFANTTTPSPSPPTTTSFGREEGSTKGG
ncbi:hypothetical protein D9613_004490 [Agrocybe pediades]|uniref:Uncharacterized protein n=1 Tax=Agrocybe pediades TaxID=84607 RepID=A0A8H4QI72_9AGAR|nr:hypothetical protein D9613_004490 [Agrocybe pediades]